MPPTSGAVVSLHFATRMFPRVTSMSVALVSRRGLPPTPLSEIRTRLVREPCDLRSSDDVVLFYGAGMAQDLTRFAAETKGGLPPAAVLAPWLDWDDVSLALDHGAASYLLENRYAFLLDEALLCTARGASILDPAIAAEQVRIASWARARERKRAEKRPEPVTEAAPDRRPRLSRRESQLMDLLASGLTVRDVAQKMFLTEKTVRNYLSRIYAKLQVRGQSEAILCWLGHLGRTESGDTPVRAGASRTTRTR